MVTYCVCPLGQVPTKRNGLPDNYWYEAFLTLKDFEEKKKKDCHYVKESVESVDYLVVENVVVDTSFNSKMVRLKGTKVISCVLFSFSFNSKMVRLKGEDGLKKVCGGFVSIPKWYD